MAKLIIFCFVQIIIIIKVLPLHELFENLHLTHTKHFTMELKPYFSPVDFDSLEFNDQFQNPSLLINTVLFQMKEDDEPVLTDVEMVIFGVPESRNSSNNRSASMAPDEIRRAFYRLYCWRKPVKILDLGNLIPGKSVEDTYEIVAEVLAYLIENKVIPIVLGGTNDLVYANYLAYAKLNKIVNMVVVDSRFDIGNDESTISSEGYLNKIILQQPNCLLNYANIGYQTYLNSPEDKELMQKLYFETYRVGMMRKDMEDVEPIVRNADLMAIDISAVRRVDAPGNPNASSNGFYGEEICQVSSYAGINDKLSSFGIYEYDPTLDYNNQTSQLIGHILWYFVEGYINRQDDINFKQKDNYHKYSVPVSDATSELVFYRSKKTERWWMVVPVINVRKNVEQKYLLPCSHKDYETACSDQIPERWWRTYNKLNR